MKTTSFTALGLTLWLMMMLHAAAHTTEEVLSQIRQSEPYLQITDSVAPDFVLEDAAGRKIGLADYRGKAVVLNFIYARCKDACPLHSELLAKVQAQVNATLMRDQVQFVTIATDTEDAAATAEVMRGHGKIHGLDPANWVFLYRGSGAPNSGINIAKAYGLEFTPTPDGDQMHGVVTHVIDLDGVMRARFHGLKFQPFYLTAFVNTLLYPDHPEDSAGTRAREHEGLRYPWIISLVVLMVALLVVSWLVLRRRRAQHKRVGLDLDHRVEGAQEKREPGSTGQTDA